jgi:predicted DsbA family dithiol-disulfide isomerase
VCWRAYPLNPEVPPEGQRLEDYLAGRDVDIPAMREKMRKVAAGEGLPFGNMRLVYNSRLAQELGKWSESRGRGDAFHHLAFHAYFADNRNIARADVLVDLAKAAGLPQEEAEAVMAARRFAEAVDRDWQRARELNIAAVPTFLANGRRLVGVHPYKKLRDLVTRQASNSSGAIL